LGYNLGKDFFLHKNYLLVIEEPPPFMLCIKYPPFLFTTDEVTVECPPVVVVPAEFPLFVFFFLRQQRQQINIISPNKRAPKPIKQQINKPN
jgi:hypothetical protein